MTKQHDQQARVRISVRLSSRALRTPKWRYVTMMGGDEFPRWQSSGNRQLHGYQYRLFDQAPNRAAKYMGRRTIVAHIIVDER
jgi:hypothetical protein